MSTAFTETSAAPADGVSATSNGSVKNADGQADGQAGAAVSCASCGGANAVDSLFCRLCGASLHAEGTSASTPSVPLDAEIIKGAPSPASDGAAASDGALTATTSEADARQARQLLDRAFTLVERGDMANALLSCRQSVALAPNAPQGFSMLGLLLERTGDLEQAAAAYARVLRLAPDSRLERESLERVRATLSQRRAEIPAFRFDEREMDEALASAPAASVPSATAVVTPSGPATVVSAGGLTPLVPTSAIGHAAHVNVTAPAPDSYPNSPLPSVVVPAPTVPAPHVAAPNISALHFDTADADAEPWWKRAARPSAFSRGLPLAGVAGLSLLFLIWARGSALSRYPQDASLPANIDTTPISTVVVPPPPGTGAAVTSPVSPGASGASVPQAPASSSANSPAGSYPISNTNGAPAPASPGAPAAGQASGGAGRAPSQPIRRQPEVRREAPRPQPVFPSTGRVIPPALPSSLPPARPLPPPAPPAVSVAPQQPQYPNAGISSSGGGPLGPAASSSNNSITLSRPRNPSAALPRPSASRAQAEAAASRAAAQGRPDAVIANTTQAVRGGGDTGYTYQQRALAFMNRGDYQRAADDFQTALSAYRDQKARGERPSEAQAGIEACQSGLKLAQMNLRR